MLHKRSQLASLLMEKMTLYRTDNLDHSKIYNTYSEIPKKDDFFYTIHTVKYQRDTMLYC